KLRTYAEGQAENKRKLDNNNQDQQQLLKKQNVIQAYAVGSGEKKPYEGSKPLFPKCGYHHYGECAPNGSDLEEDDHNVYDYCSSEESDTASTDHLSDNEEEVLDVRTKKRDPALKNKTSKMFDESFFTSIFSGMPGDDFDDSSDPKTEDQDKLGGCEEPLMPIPLPVALVAVRNAYHSLYDTQLEVVCLMLASMSLKLQKNLENYNAYDMLHMKGYDNLECLGYPMPQKLSTIAELHSILKLNKKGTPKKADTPAILVIREGKIQKDKYKQRGAKGSGKGKGNTMRAAVKAIGSFDLILPSGLIIVLDNCHYAPSITGGVVSLSRLLDNGYIHTYTSYGISVSKDNVFYFSFIPRDSIYEIDMHDLLPNVNSIYNVSNKRSKRALDSTYLWHC
nr:zinc finger, CCHC-type [Tanacetum cinerariifolium]